MTTAQDWQQDKAETSPLPRTPLDVNKFYNDSKGLTEADLVSPLAEQSNRVADVTAQHLSDSDLDRMRVATQLLNNFNYAIQVQARRAQWTVDDWRAFIIALQAVDGIGRAVSDRQRLADLDKDVQDTVRMFGKARAT